MAEHPSLATKLRSIRKS